MGDLGVVRPIKTFTTRQQALMLSEDFFGKGTKSPSAIIAHTAKSPIQTRVEMNVFGKVAIFLFVICVVILIFAEKV